MKKVATFAAVVIAASLPTTAFAETFSGPYVGVAAGYNNDDLEYDDFDTVGATFDANNESITFAGYVGYDYRVSKNFVAGVEGGFGFTPEDELTDTVGVRTRLNQKYYFDLSARLGYVVADKALVYARGGYINQRATASVYNGSTTVKDTGHNDGWQIGGGVEYLLKDKISTRVEYRYSDLGENGASLDRHQVLVGVAYRF